MNLFVETKNAVFWAFRVFWRFFRLRPGTTTGLLFCLLGEKISTLLAFFLPLKVIILAGTDRVPRYFRFFIEEETRMEWIIGLAVASVVFFVLSFVFSSLSRKLSVAGSMEVLQGANQIAVTSAQREEARSYYDQFSQIMSGFFLVSLAFAFLFIVDHRVFYALSALVLFQYIGSFVLLRFGDFLNPRGVLKIILKNLGGYLGFFANVNFLAGFFVILVPYVFFEYDGNILFAILAILLMRQAMGALSTSISLTAELWSNRLKVEPMVFREVTAQRKEKSVSRDLRLTFGKARREMVLREQLAKMGFDAVTVSSEFRDVSFRMFYTFLVSVRVDRSAEERFVQDQVFSERQLRLLEHESFLFDHLDRRQMYAPLVLGRYEDGPFKCQLVEAGLGTPVGSKEWPEVCRYLLEFLWCTKLPVRLVNAYKSGNVTLAGRLSDQHIKRVSVSLDTKSQQAIFAKFSACFEKIVGVIADVPLHIFNPDMDKAVNVFRFPDDSFRVMYWQRWAIDHIGVFMPGKIPDDELDSVLGRVRAARGLPDGSFEVAHVRLVGLFKKLEALILQEQYNAALGTMGAILENELVLAFE